MLSNCTSEEKASASTLTGCHHQAKMPASLFRRALPRATAVQLQYHCTTVTRLCTQVFLVFQCSLAVPQYICYLDWLALLASLKTATANGKVTPGACNCTTVTLLYLFCFTGLVCIQESNAIVMIISCNFIVANVGFTEGRKPFCS